MKDRINRKIYDTDKSEFICEYWNNERFGSELYILEKLYITRNNEFFRYAIGGINTCYAARHFESVYTGYHIIPMSIKEACSWIKEHYNNK